MTMEINQSLNHTWKVTNVVMYCDTRTNVHIHTHTHTHKKKNIYIYIIIVILIIVVIISTISDFIIINLVHITRIGIILNLL